VLGLRNLVAKEVIGDTSIKAIDVSTPNSKILHLDAEMINKVSRLGHVERISKSYSYPGILSFKGSETDTVTYGIDGNYADLNAFNLVAGRAITDTDVDAVVVNRAVLRVLAQKDDRSLLNKELRIVIPLQNASSTKKQIEKEFKVVGVIDTSTGPEVFISNGIFEGAQVKNYSQVKVVTDSTESVAGLRKQIESLGYQTTSPVDTLDQINEVFRIFTFVLVGFGAIGMIVAVLGMFNTLTISLIERTKEIGLMIALGARSRDMFRLFVFEALLLSLSGAIIGILFAMVAGAIITLLMNGFAQSRGVTDSFQLFSYPLWLIASMVGFMLFVGFLVVLFPARRARKINPIDALRRE
jgi:ABC-type antimicrobial peptide transport system permease subunit